MVYYFYNEGDIVKVHIKHNRIIIRDIYGMYNYNNVEDDNVFDLFEINNGNVDIKEVFINIHVGVDLDYCINFLIVVFMKIH